MNFGYVWKRTPRWQSKCSRNLSHGVEVEREAAACGAYFYVNMQTGRVVIRNRPKDPFTRNTYHELKLISVDYFNLHRQPTWAGLPDFCWVKWIVCVVWPHNKKIKSFKFWYMTMVPLSCLLVCYWYETTDLLFVNPAYENYKHCYYIPNQHQYPVARAMSVFLSAHPYDNPIWYQYMYHSHFSRLQTNGSLI